MKEIKVNTAFSIALIVSAVLIIGGLTGISTTMQSASAAHGSGGRECIEFGGVESCRAGGGGSGTGGGGSGGSGGAIVCSTDTNCVVPHVSSGGGGGQGGGGGGGVFTSCTFDANGDPICKKTPIGGGGGVGGGSD